MSYLSTVLADAPVHYWRMADGGGGINHDIGSTKVHSVGPFECLGYSGPCATGGSARSSGQGVGVTRQSVAGSTPFSIEFWVWPTEQNHGSTVELFAWDAVTAGVGISIALLTGRTIQCFIGASAALNGAIVLTLQQWHHVVLTHAAGTAKLYVDGILDFTLAVANPAGWNVSIGIAEKANGTTPILDAWFAEVATYAAALTAGQVTAHYLAAEQPAQSPLWVAGGAFSTSTGQADAGLLNDVIAIYNAVHKVY